MKELVDCGCNGICNADIDLSDDNGYRYVLEELKATRAHIDEIINVIEMRMKKDAIIDKVLDTEYEDEDAKVSVKNSDKETVLDALIKAIAIQNAMNGPINKQRIVSPWWSIYPSNINTWF